MTERKTFTPYGYNPYQNQQPGGPSLAAQQERVELQRRNRGLIDKIFGEEIAGKMRTPIFATVSLLAVGVAFAAVIAISYPSGSDNAGGNVPVITASADSFKVQPGDAAGVTVAHQDSRVFDVVSSADPIANPFDGTGAVENLLEPTPPAEEAVNVVEALAEEATQGAEAAAGAIEPAAGEAAEGVKESVESLLIDVPEANEAPVEDVLKKIEPDQVAKITQTREKVPPQDLVKAAEEAPKQPETLHAAGSSPDTIAFVRSVLDQTDSKKTGAVSQKVAEAQAANLNAIAPASGGDSIKAPSVTAGNYYVQLGSVTSRVGADSEWARFTKSLPIAGLDYRVQEANLGERGTYYRIQAGPMSQDSANSLCDSIKAQKPGGCLVVK